MPEIKREGEVPFTADPKKPQEGIFITRLICNIPGCDGRIKFERKVHDFTDHLSQPMSGPIDWKGREEIHFWCEKCGVAYGKHFILDECDKRKEESQGQD